jgi:TPR repeat protein
LIGFSPLALLLEKGEGVASDFARSLQYYTLSAKQNNSYALARLGLLFLEGKGVNFSFFLSCFTFLLSFAYYTWFVYC